MPVPGDRPTNIDDDLRRIGRALLQARRSRGLSQRRLEALSSVPQSTISRLENGRRAGARISHLARLARVLGRIVIDPPDDPTSRPPW
jgi:transcriptional regulator with XRE-family HTH domain